MYAPSRDLGFCVCCFVHTQNSKCKYQVCHSTHVYTATDLRRAMGEHRSKFLGLTSNSRCRRRRRRAPRRRPRSRRPPRRRPRRPRRRRRRPRRRSERGFTQPPGLDPHRRLLAPPFLPFVLLRRHYSLVFSLELKSRIAEAHSVRQKPIAPDRVPTVVRGSPKRGRVFLKGATPGLVAWKVSIATGRLVPCSLCRTAPADAVLAFLLPLICS